MRLLLASFALDQKVSPDQIIKNKKATFVRRLLW